MSLDGDRWLGLLGLRSFRILLWFSIAAIVSLILRYALIRGTIPWADFATAATLSGATSLGVWMHHRRLMREFRLQAEELRIELRAAAASVVLPA